MRIKSNFWTLNSTEISFLNESVNLLIFFILFFYINYILFFCILKRSNSAKNVETKPDSGQMDGTMRFSVKKPE